MTKLGEFALETFQRKYAFTSHETWPEASQRVAENVLGALGYGSTSEEVREVARLISLRKFIPGGRYLYAAGRDLHQVNNCLLLRCGDSREEWAETMWKSGMALMTGAGIGVVYSDIRPKDSIIKRTGGVASGPLAPMGIVNEIGRRVMQGGSRRSAIWAGLSWRHADVMDFIRVKDWNEDLRALKERDWTTPMEMEMTNVSVCLDDDFFEAYNTPGWSRTYSTDWGDQTVTHEHAQQVYWTALRRMLKTGEPGFSIDTGANAGEDLRNAPVTGDTRVLTDQGYQRVREIVGQSRHVWTGEQFAPNVVFKRTMTDAPVVAVEMTGGRVIRCEPSHEFLVERYKGAGRSRRLVEVDRVPARDLRSGDQMHVSLPSRPWIDSLDVEAYTLGFIYGDGSFTNSRAEITFCTEESRVCAAVVAGSSHVSSVNWSDGRGYVRAYFGTDVGHLGGRSKYRFPEEMYESSPAEIASFVAGLWDSDGNYDETQHRCRLSSSSHEFLRGVGRLLEQLGILSGVAKNGNSTYGGKQEWQLAVMGEHVPRFAEMIPTQRVKINLGDWKSYRSAAIKVLSVKKDGIEDVFCADVQVPEHSFMAEGVIISNCTEVSSADDSDICNLGSINLGQIDSLSELDSVIELATLFLVAGTVYSHVPYEKVADVREQNRRLGLGLMGMHEWLLKRGLPYAPDAELGTWLESYEHAQAVASAWSDEHSLSRPVKTRAIAPNGTIGIVAETTTGIEPIFCAAYKRTYLTGGVRWTSKYVIDPVADRLVKQGIDPDTIEDAYSLTGSDVGRRVKFQHWVQRYVDHGISSTINLSEPITDQDEAQTFGDMLMGYLPGLRGVTCYPNGARAGQPIVAVPFKEALEAKAMIETNEDTCVGGVCSI